MDISITVRASSGRHCFILPHRQINKGRAQP
jgi:hypothetical protein